jgi:serine/threonine protein kinase
MSLPDHVLEHLAQVLQAPDLSRTRYELLAPIGAGGTSTVYRVRDRLLEREVALKVIEQGALDGDALEEARLLALLEHPGIVAVHDAGVLDDGRPFCVMQLIEGADLNTFVVSGPPLAQRLSVFEKLCEAVAFAHSRGVIHRDLKPSNVMIGSFGRVVVLDWGIALRSSNGVPENEVAGTWCYMAPEQKRSGPLDARTDIYALGILLRELLAAPAPKPLLAMAAKAHAEQPQHRYGAVNELLGDVGRFRESLPVAAYRESVWEGLVRFGKRNRVLLVLIAAYVLVRLALFFVGPR